MPLQGVPAGLKVREPVPGFYLIADFDKYLGFDAQTLIGELDATVPKRGAGDAIAPGQLQWVLGSNKDLQYRGNELKRRKIWAQNGSVDEGVRIYSYTGFTYPVAQATSDWNAPVPRPEPPDEQDKPDIEPDDDTPLRKLADRICPFKIMSEKMNAFMQCIGGWPMNHLIVTAYEDGSHNIGYHYDKERSIRKPSDGKDSWIAVLKLGPNARPFALRKLVADKAQQEKEPDLFREVVPVGTLILFNLATNLATQHAVPALQEGEPEVGLSGSIVWRCIDKVMTPSQLSARIAVTERQRAKRVREGA